MGKIINFGSLNIDLVYPVAHILRPGETLSAPSRAVHPGGKGLNQSIAAARAGARVLHAGAVGEDGAFLRALLAQAGADVSLLVTAEAPTGHAVIQVEPSGQNSILVCPGANGTLDAAYAARVLQRAEPGDLVLTQNETSAVLPVLTQAKALGLTVVLNPSPITPALTAMPLDCVGIFLLNETEGEALTGETEPEAILTAMAKRYPQAETVLTLGRAGAMRRYGGQVLRQRAYPVRAVDTTAAGDTWTGYYLAGLLAGIGPREAMRRAAMASAIAVTRPGAAPSVPLRDEVDDALRHTREEDIL